MCVSIYIYIYSIYCIEREILHVLYASFLPTLLRTVACHVPRHSEWPCVMQEHVTIKQCYFDFNWQKLKIKIKKYTINT